MSILDKFKHRLSPLILLLLLPGCAEELVEETVIRPVRTMRVGEQEAEGRRVFPGTVQALQRAQLSFRVSGPLVQLPGTRGQRVKRGARLAQIDPRDFQNAILNLEARLAELQAQYSSMQVARPEDIRALEATLAASQARLVEAGATLRRYENLYQNDNVSKAEYDQRRAARDVAQAELRRAQESLQIGRTGARAEDREAMEARIRSMEAQLGQARDALKDTTLRAPYPGIVAEIYVENFEFVRAQEPMVSLQDVSTIEIVAQIPEIIIARGQRDQLPGFVARFESLPGAEFAAKPTEIAAQADPTTRTYAVTFQTPQPPEGNILSGMTAEILLEEAGDLASSFTVPLTAIFADEQDATYVWILNAGDMTVAKTRVSVGEMIGDSANILEGVNPGDTVITAGTHALREGEQVREITDELRDRR